MKSRVITGMAALGAAAALALAWFSAPARAQKPAPRSAPATIRAEGPLEAETGAHALVGTEMAGTIGHLAVKDRQDVIYVSSRRRHPRLQGDWSSDVCSSDLRCGATSRGRCCRPRAPPRPARPGCGPSARRPT